MYTSMYQRGGENERESIKSMSSLGDREKWGGATGKVREITKEKRRRKCQRSAAATHTRREDETASQEDRQRPLDR